MKKNNHNTRIRSAMVRRLDHIAKSLDCIADALCRMHPYGNNDVIIDKFDVSQAGGNSKVSIQTIDKAIKNSGTIQAGEFNANNSNVGGSIRSIVNSQTGNGTQQIAGRDVNNNTGSFNSNSDEAIKNLAIAIKNQ